jgi:tetratricopeptide (TPR) repeat protein
MVDLPLTDSAMEASHLKIQSALFNIGEVYRNDLKDYPLAIDAYKELIKRYPESEYKVPSYYSLYKVYSQQGDLTQAETYKNMIIRNYPESQYAKVLVDPDYFKQFEQEEIQRKEDYLKTLELYNQGSFSEVIGRCNLALGKNEISEYTPKHRYIRSLAMGEVYGISVLKSELEKITEEFKNDPVAKSSEDLLVLIQKNELNNIKDISIAQKTDTLAKPIDDEIAQLTIEEIEKLYEYNPESKHYIAVIISNEADINQLKFNIINFNLDFYIQKSYDLESNEFNEYFKIVTVQYFTNSDEASEYCNKFNEEEERIFADVKSSNYQIFIISESNLSKLTEEKMVRDYLLFYNKFYQK